jgi:hypothetical protein
MKNKKLKADALDALLGVCFFLSILTFAYMLNKSKSCTPPEEDTCAPFVGK